MTTYTALTTVDGEAAAQALAEAVERLDPAPTAIGVLEIEDGSGRREVGVYFTAPPDGIGLALLAAVHGARPFKVSRVEDRDWVAQVRRELTPVEAGRFILCGGHDADRIAVNRVGLRIEAAMAFGTGHHGATRGCLLLLERLLRRGGPRGAKPRRVADIGCGTGVLAMAAAKVWRAPCVATDIDPVACRTAAENARANRLHPWTRTGQAVGFRSDPVRARGPYDVIFANILAAPLKRMAPELARHLASGGVAILSGSPRPVCTVDPVVFFALSHNRAPRVVGVLFLF